MTFAEDLGNRLFQFGFDRLQSRSGLVLVIFGIIVGGVCLFAGLDIGNVNAVEWGIIGVLALVVWLAWLQRLLP